MILTIALPALPSLTALEACTLRCFSQGNRARAFPTCCVVKLSNEKNTTKQQHNKDNIMLNDNHVQQINKRTKTRKFLKVTRTSHKNKSTNIYKKQVKTIKWSTVHH